jgi:hypothetical protein
MVTMFVYRGWLLSVFPTIEGPFLINMVIQVREEI